MKRFLPVSPKAGKRAKVLPAGRLCPWWDESRRAISGTLPLDPPPVSSSGSLCWIYHSRNDGGPSLVTQVTPITDESPVDTAAAPKKKSFKRGKSDDTVRARKVALRLTPGQKKILQSWFGVTRYVYNKTLDLVVKQGHKPNFKDLKKVILPPEKKRATPKKKGQKDDKKPKRKENKHRRYRWWKVKQRTPWLLDHRLCPYDVKSEAINEFCQALKKTTERMKDKPFEMKPKLKKKRTQSVAIPTRSQQKCSCWLDDDGITLFKTHPIGKLKVRRKNELVKLRALVGDGARKQVTIKYEYGRYYAIFLYPIEKPLKQPKETSRVVALDPGVRTFQTTFDNEGNYAKFGQGSISTVYRHCLGIDRLLSEHSTMHREAYSNRKERNYFKNERRKARKLLDVKRHRVKDWVRDAHCHIAKVLCESYDDVLISRFRVSEMVLRGGRIINSETARKMMSWGHYQFRQRLKFKAETTGTRVHEVGEHYTSKTCGRCGLVHQDLGTSEVFRCPYCSWEIDRDFNGARNIFVLNVGQVGTVSRKTG